MIAVRWIQSMRESVLVAVLIAAPFILAGALVAEWRGALVGLLVALIVEVVAYVVGKPIILRMVDAVSIDRDNAPELDGIVQRLAERAGIRQPSVAISRLRTPNAFAAGGLSGGVVGVTSGLLEITTAEELEAVLAHEIAHLAQRDRFGATISAVFAALPGAIGVATGSDLFFAPAFRRNLHRRWGGRNLRPLRDAIAFCVVPLAALLVRSSVSRSSELAADARAATLIDDSENLVTALRKIDALAGRVVSPLNPAVSHLLVIHPFGEERVSRMFNTHPTVAERLDALATTTR